MLYLSGQAEGWWRRDEGFSLKMEGKDSCVGQLFLWLRDIAFQSSSSHDVALHTTLNIGSYKTNRDD